MRTITVLLADDHDIVREGTRRLLEQAHDLAVVAEAGTGEEAVRLAGSLRPDIVVMDVRMPGLNGLEATRRVKANAPDTAVLILSAYEDDQYVFPLLEAGASGYLLKTSSGDDLIRAIHAICERNEKVLDPHLTGKVVDRLSGGSRTPHGDLVEALTEREVQVLQAVADGRSNKEIAESLSISTNTVQVHLRNIFGKLGVASRTEAVASGLRHGIVHVN